MPQRSTSVSKLDSFKTTTLVLAMGRTSWCDDWNTIPRHLPDEPRPFPVDPLFDLVSKKGPRMVRYGVLCRSHGEVATLALRLGVDRQQVYRWSSQGIGIYVADAIAIRLGRHPSLIWTDWFSYSIEESNEFDVEVAS